MRRAWLGFLVLTLLGTWMPAWALRGSVHVEQFSVPWRFFMSSVLYVGVMGWQPLVAVLVTRRYLEPALELNAGLRRSPEKFLWLGIVLPAGAILGASALQLVFAKHSPAASTAHAVELAPSLLPSLLSLLVVLAAAALIYLQCVIEEVAWRGYFLVRMMETAGPWRGLVLHGLVWGVWYAPILILGSGAAGNVSGLQAVEFAVTCTLLGILLGWLRLASHSVLPAIIANASLTVGAGLPLMLSGVSAETRGAVYLPIGWVPLFGIVCYLAITRQRQAVVTPRPPARPSRRFSLALH